MVGATRSPVVTSIKTVCFAPDRRGRLRRLTCDALASAWARAGTLPLWLSYARTFPVLACLLRRSNARQVRLGALTQAGGLVTDECVLDQCAAAQEHGYFQAVGLPRRWRSELAVALDDVAVLRCPAYAGGPWAVASVEGWTWAEAARRLCAKPRTREG